MVPAPVIRGHVLTPRAVLSFTCKIGGEGVSRLISKLNVSFWMSWMSVSPCLSLLLDR